MALPQHGPVPFNNTVWGPSAGAERFANKLPRPLRVFCKEKFRSGANSKTRLAQSANRCIAIINELEEKAIGPPTSRSKYAKFLDEHPSMKAPEGDLPKYTKKTNKQIALEKKLFTAGFQSFLDAAPPVQVKPENKDKGTGGFAQSIILRPSRGAAERTYKALRSTKKAERSSLAPIEMSPRAVQQRSSPYDSDSFTNPFSDPHHVFQQKQQAAFEASMTQSIMSSESTTKKKAHAADADLEDSLLRVAQIGLTGPAALGYVLQRRFGSIAKSFAFFDLNGKGGVTYSQWVTCMASLHLDCRRCCGMSAEQVFKEIDKRLAKKINLKDMELACCGEKRKKAPVSESNSASAKVKSSDHSSPFAIKVRADLQKMVESGTHLRQYPATLTKKERRIVVCMAEELSMWAFSRSTNGKEKVVTVACETEFASLVSQSLQQLNYRECKVFAQGLSRVQLWIIQALAAERGLWCEWRWDTDNEEKQLLVHHLGRLAVDVRQVLLSHMGKQEPAVFKGPLLDVEAEVVHAIANELNGISVSVEGPEDSAKVVASCTSKFVWNARRELDALEPSEETIYDAGKLRQEDLECLNFLAKERSRHVEMLGKKVTIKAETMRAPDSLESESSGAESDDAAQDSGAESGDASGLLPMSGTWYGLSSTMTSTSRFNRWSLIRRWPRVAKKKRKAAWNRFQLLSTRHGEFRLIVLDSFLELCEELGLHDIDAQEQVTEAFNAVLKFQEEVQPTGEGALSFEFFWLALQILAHETSWSKIALVRFVV